MNKNNSELKKHSEGFMAGLVFGGIIGAALAFILEDEGIEVHNLVKKKAKLALKGLKETAEESQETIEKNVKEAKENIQEGLEVVEKKVEDKKEEVAKVIQKPQKSSVIRRFFIKSGKKLAK